MRKFLTFYPVTNLIIGLYSVSTSCGQDPEVILRDGSSTKSVIQFNNKRLICDKGEIAFLRFPSPSQVTFWNETRKIRFGKNELLNAEIIELNAKEIIINTKWKKRISIPREDLVSIERSSFGQLVQSLQIDPSREFDYKTQSAYGLVILKLNPIVETGKITLNESEYSISQDQKMTTIRKKGKIIHQEEKKEEQFLVIDTRDKNSFLWFNQKVMEQVDSHPQRIQASSGFVISSKEFNNRMLDTKKNRDTKQDYLVTPEGDEIFGQLISIHKNEYEFRSSRLKTYRSDQVDEVGFHSTNLLDKGSSGEHVKLKVSTWNGQYDTILGVLLFFSSEKITIQHIILGELTFLRSELREIERLYWGDYIPLPKQTEVKFPLENLDIQRFELEIQCFPSVDKSKWEVWMNGSRTAQLDSQKVSRCQIISVPLSQLRRENQLEIRPEYQEGKIPEVIQIDRLAIRIHRKN